MYTIHKDIYHLYFLAKLALDSSLTSTYFAGYAWSILFPLQLLILFARFLSCKIYFRLSPLLYLGVFVYPGLHHLFCRYIRCNFRQGRNFCVLLCVWLLLSDTKLNSLYWHSIWDCKKRPAIFNTTSPCQRDTYI